MEEASHQLENTINGFVELMDIYTLPNADKKFVELDEIIDGISLDLHELRDNIGSIINKNIKPNDKIFFNDSYLKIILKSLIENSIRHNLEQENLKIDISFKRITNCTIGLVVEDNGKGIDLLIGEDTLKKPFYKYGALPECIGIGLSKVEAIAHVTRNTFTIESMPGEGTKCLFIFREYE